MSNTLNVLFCNANDIDLSNYKRFEKDLVNIINWKQYKAYKNEINQKEYLVGSLLIANVLNRLKIPTSQLVRTQGKKPYIKGNKIYFSISHSNGYVTLIYDEEPVGCDIQTITEFDFSKITKTWFSVEENIYIKNQKKSYDSFYKIWCCKESLIKATGCKPSQISKMDINFKQDWTTTYQGKKYYFITKKIASNMFAACSVKKNFKIRIYKIKF